MILRRRRPKNPNPLPTTLQSVGATMPIEDYVRIYNLHRKFARSPYQLNGKVVLL
jgi:hypothetical protein